MDTYGPSRAAFYDLDGTLVSTNVLYPYAYYAATDSGLLSRIRRLTGFALNLPKYGILDSLSRKAFNESFYESYEGFTKDRLWIMGEEVFEQVLKPALYPGVEDMIRRSKEQGILQVLCTGAIEQVVAPLAKYLDIDYYAANKLEFDTYDRATGKLCSPIMAGANKADWVRQFATRHSINLNESFAYADSFSDYAMLVTVGNPCAVNPDRRLRSAANEYDWPILDLTRTARISS